MKVFMKSRQPTGVIVSQFTMQTDVSGHVWRKRIPVNCMKFLLFIIQRHSCRVLWVQHVSSATLIRFLYD